MPDWGNLAHFHLLRPWWLLALLPLAWAWRQLWQARNPAGRWRQSIAPHLLQAMLVRHGRARWFNPVNMGALLAVFAVLAMAGPTWRQQPSPFSEDVAPLIVMLDASKSMDQRDIQPSRLERAKQKVMDLLALRAGGRTGLVVYAGTAHAVIPPTNDPDVVKLFLNAIRTDIMPRQGKAPEKALVEADRMLRDAPAPGTILMIGDGVGPHTLEAFREYFARHPYQLLILGMGRERPEHQDESKGFVPLERRALEQLADAAGGRYVSLTVDKEDVRRINRRINNHLAIVDEADRPWVDAGYGLLFPAALLLLLWFRKGWTLHWAWVGLILGMLAAPAPALAAADDESLGQRFISAFMNLWLTPDQQGWYYMRRGEYRKAAEHFDNIAWRGVAYYRAGDFKAAIAMFSRLDTAEGYFNLGNAYAHSRQYLLAVRSYDRALKLDPNMASARKNRAIIQGIIDEINLLSATQQAEESEASKELGEGEPRTAEGAERKDFVRREQEQLTAEDLLLDDELNELWMRQVQKDPSRFLSVKFHMQLAGQEGAHAP